MDKVKFVLLASPLAALIGAVWFARRRIRERPRFSTKARTEPAAIEGLAVLPARSPFAAVLFGRSTAGPVGPIPLSRSIPNVIGSDPRCCNVVVDDHHISRRHAQVLWEENGFVIYDLGSTDGTYVNGRRVRTQPLAKGDVIQLGDTTLLLQIESPDGASERAFEPALHGSAHGILVPVEMPGLPGGQPEETRTGV